MHWNQCLCFVWIQSSAFSPVLEILLQDWLFLFFPSHLDGCGLAHTHSLTVYSIAFCTLLLIWHYECSLFMQQWTENRPKNFRVSDWGQVSPKNILHVVYNLEMAVTCQKRPLSCLLQSKLLFYMSVRFSRSGGCQFPSILWFVVMRTLWFCKYSADKVWGMTFNHKVLKGAHWTWILVLYF